MSRNVRECRTHLLCYYYHIRLPCPRRFLRQQTRETRVKLIGKPHSLLVHFYTQHTHGIKVPQFYNILVTNIHSVPELQRAISDKYTNLSSCPWLACVCFYCCIQAVETRARPVARPRCEGLRAGISVFTGQILARLSVSCQTPLPPTPSLVLCHRPGAQ